MKRFFRAKPSTTRLTFARNDNSLRLSHPETEWGISFFIPRKGGLTPPLQLSCILVVVVLSCTFVAQKYQIALGKYPSPLRGAPLQGSNCLLRSEWQTTYLSSYICTVIDSFCFSQPKRHNLRLCCVWPVAAKLVDNKTLFCHSDRAQRRGISVSIHFSFLLSPFPFLLSPFYFEFSPDVEMTMFQCATIGRIALNIVYNPFTKVHYTYAGGKSANGIREFPVIL